MKAAILGATGLVGQRFVQMLSDHEWFEIAALNWLRKKFGWRIRRCGKLENGDTTEEGSCRAYSTALGT